MGDRWNVSSVNGQKNGQEGEWTSLDQIQGMQTLLKDNIFGISFRIIPKSGKKFSDIYMPENDILNVEEARENNASIAYSISEISVSPLNPYYRIMKNSGVDVDRVFNIIKQKLNEGDWSWVNVKGLMDYGVVEGIYTKLLLEDRDNKTWRAQDFCKDEDIEAMRQIEWKEHELSKHETDEERIEAVERYREMREKDGLSVKGADALIYQKYKAMVKGKEKSKMSGAEHILEYMKKHNLTIQDLSLALAMAQATKTGVIETEGHIVDENTMGIQEIDGPDQTE